MHINCISFIYVAHSNSINVVARRGKECKVISTRYNSGFGDMEI
jgi:hypothetical protein